MLEQELAAAGIEVVPPSEPDALPTGKLGENFTFERCWYYWRVRGDVPILAAREMYADSVGGWDVRVVGLSGGDHPDRWARVAADGTAVIPNYDIDSQEGLALFVNTLRKYGLIL